MALMVMSIISAWVRPMYGEAFALFFQLLFLFRPVQLRLRMTFSAKESAF